MSVPEITEGVNLPRNNDPGKKTDPLGFSRALNDAISRAENSETQGSGQAALIEIGTISKETPTVSHILKSNPEYKDRCWDIVFSRVNEGKPFTKMREGTKVSVRAGSNELVWGGKRSEAAHRSSADPAGGGDSIEGKKGPDESGIKSVKTIVQERTTNSADIDVTTLAEAVKPYLGTPYNEIDCYGLVIRGLINQGVKYNGHGGLRERLEGMAALNGLPSNAYFSGEGLVEKAGVKIYSKSIPHISNARDKADEIYSEMSRYLREGLILSFSTPTRGHTGVVSRKGDDWTYINSGVIDHEISSGTVSKRVGEEFLKAEIHNWCALAAGRNEPLIVTIGNVDVNRLRDSDRPEVI